MTATPSTTDQAAPVATDQPAIELVSLVHPNRPVAVDPTAVDQATVATYRDGDAKAKGKIRADLAKAKDAAARAGDLIAWNKADNTLNACTSAKSGSSPKASVDPAKVLNARVAALILAASNVMVGTYVPDGLDVTGVDFEALTALWEGFDEKFASATNGLDADDLASISDSAKKLASSKLTRSTESHDMGEVIANAFDGQPSGTVLTIQQVVNEASIDGYRPSPGAVAYRMFGGSGVTGFSAIEKTATSVRMIRKD